MLKRTRPGFDVYGLFVVFTPAKCEHLTFRVQRAARIRSNLRRPLFSNPTRSGVLLACCYMCYGGANAVRGCCCCCCGCCPRCCWVVIFSRSTLRWTPTSSRTCTSRSRWIPTTWSRPGRRCSSSPSRRGGSRASPGWTSSGASLPSGAFFLLRCSCSDGWWVFGFFSRVAHTRFGRDTTLY